MLEGEVFKNNGAEEVHMTKNYDISELTRFAEDVVSLAGKEALSFYGKGRKGKRFDENLVTEAELHLNGFFESQLNAQYPEHQLFFNNDENREYTHDEKRYLWVFDALDGVANFQAGIPLWGVSLALLENFWPVLGVFYIPVTEDLFQARAGEKAFWGGREMSPRKADDINDESVLFTYSRFHQHYGSNFPGKIRDLGCTGAHMCYVAAGLAEGAVISKESYQGLAATRVITEAAGLRIYKMDGSRITLNTYLDGDVIDGNMVVCSPDFYKQIRKSLSETRVRAA